MAQHSYRARLDFSIRDGDATNNIRAKAEAETLRVYQEQVDHLAQIPETLEEFLRKLVEAESIEEFARNSKHAWDVTPSELQTLKDNISLSWLNTALAPLKEGLNELGIVGIVRGEDRETERGSGRSEIFVRSQNEPQPLSRRLIDDTAVYPTGVRKFLGKKLQLVLLNKPQKFREVFLDLLVHKAAPTLRLDAMATDDKRRAARESAEEVYRAIPKDTLILDKGDIVTPQSLQIIEKEENAYKSQADIPRESDARYALLMLRMGKVAGITGLFLALFVLLVLYAIQFVPSVFTSNTRIFGVYAICLAVLFAVRIFEHIGVDLHWTPVVLAAMILTVAAGPTLAFGITSLLTLTAGVASGEGFRLTLPLLVAGSVAILGLLRLRHRTDLFEAGMFAGFVHGIMVWIMALVEVKNGSISGPWGQSLAGLAGGVLAGSVLTGALPYVERFFDVSTELRLLEWTDQNQPLLRKLALEAPGTYHHSAVVGNMAEAAAEEIGANALLARAGGYLHDIGKLNRPEYFVENRGSMSSLHDGLSPMLSALIITAHTKDGVDLAMQYGVPSPLRRIITEHHGTRVAEFFFKKAQQETTTTDEIVRDTTFRYRGPKPRSPESAIIMLADSVESVARTLVAPSPSRVERLVHEITQKRLDDGQLDESRLNITDIRRIEKSLVRSLLAISHPRVRYPTF